MVNDNDIEMPGHLGIVFDDIEMQGHQGIVFLIIIIGFFFFFFVHLQMLSLSILGSKMLYSLTLVTGCIFCVCFIIL